MTGARWTCASCGVIASYLPGFDPTARPAGWDQLNGVVYCLGCQRTLAGEARVAALTGEDSPAERRRANDEGRIEFELARDPDRCDTRVARASGTNVALVRQVRDRLGVYGTRPV